MLLTALTIVDFGPYRGENTFNLRTTPDSPVVLVGGKNGAGKTTFFESIQICLHGRSALGRRTSQSEYEQRIREGFHSGGSHDADEATIRLQFEYSNFGDRDTYTVERHWRDRGQSIAETVTVTRNGEPLDDIEEDQWEDFLKELIPPGLSQLFFFDGEKVQQLAAAIEDDKGFEESMLSLLGLDLVERLEADLSIYLSQKLDESGKTELSEAIETLREDKEAAEDELQTVRDDLADTRAKLGELATRISQKEDQLAQEGGTFAKQRSEYKERRDQLNAAIDEIEEEIRDVARDAYPFALVPDLASSVIDRLEDQAATKARLAARDEVVAELDALSADAETLAELEADPDVTADVIEGLRTTLAARLEDPTAETDFVDQFSEQERQLMHRLTDRAQTEIPATLGRLTRQLEEKSRLRTKTEEQLSRAPEQAAISPIIEEINELTERRGRLKAELETLEEREEELQAQVTRLETEIDRKLEQRAEIEDVSERAELASRTRKAVQAYQQRVTDEKLNRLEDVLTTHYRSLSNKGDFYQAVHIDKDTLTLSIETTNGDHKAQSQLSAGERQIFATSLLWALADISGRPLPFLIDTPLGRLDQEHRDYFVERFLPEAAHQVIVLSTDTEITDEYRDTLAPSISAAYHLEYQEDAGYTAIEPGYFDGELAEVATEMEPVDIDADTTDLTKYIDADDQQVSLGGFSDE